MGTSRTIHLTFHNASPDDDTLLAWLKHSFPNTNITIGQGIAVNGIPADHILLEVRR